jgi:hypothetical protein
MCTNNWQKTDIVLANVYWWLDYLFWLEIDIVLDDV